MVIVKSFSLEKEYNKVGGRTLGNLSNIFLTYPPLTCTQVDIDNLLYSGNN